MQHRRPLLACAAVALALPLLQLLPSTNFAVTAPAAHGGGLSRKQSRSQLKTRGNLPPVLEWKEEEEPVVVPKEPVPERRVPYTMHIVSHLPTHKHLHEDSRARRAIQEKIVHSFHTMEELIKHVEVNLQVSENFHVEKPRKTNRNVGAGSPDDEDTEPQANVRSEDSHIGSRMLAPYIFKVTVSLHNGRAIVLANAEKHAQPTLNEGLDHMVEVIRKSLREEKDRDIQARKKKKAMLQRSMGNDDDDDLLAFEPESDFDGAELEKDREVEKIYKAVEAASE